MIVSRLAQFAAGLTDDTLPDAVRHAAKRCLLDWLGAAISGSPVLPATLMTAALADELGHGRARLVPSGKEAPVRTAALINGTAAHAMEVDDIFRDGIYHPGPPVIAAALAAVLYLREHEGLKAEDVQSITVASYAKAIEICGSLDPQTVYEAKFSLPYSVAVALITGAARFDVFRQERLSDPAIRALMAKVTVVLDDEAEVAFPGRRSATVTVETTDGRMLDRYAPTRKGDPDDPLSDQELEAKYLDLAAPVIGDEAAGRLAEAVWRLEESGQLRDLGAGAGN